jgi:hypothetical protein
MGILDRLKSKKEKHDNKKKQRTIVTNLEKICGDDKETYEALRGTMYLKPKKIGMLSDEAEKKAKEFEKQGNTLKAKLWYESAGRLAIYEGDVSKVKKYFEKCAKLSPDSSYLILRNPDKAVKRAQEYYQKYLT